ncbi:hypothetical protein SO802_009907 [Lithocarpus litseifolius]|uniref:Uncharacterized protein n=1 Tax=Lithocarpus litseifolius TaxID=425828 RepID=A0AAW2DGJ5_9ROSI
MTQEGISSVGIVKHFIPYSYYNNTTYGKEYVDSVMVTLRGWEFKLSGRSLGYVKIFNLSRNKLTGKLPSEILSLLGLVSLNISRNNLIGEIPQMIGLASTVTNPFKTGFYQPGRRSDVLIEATTACPGIFGSGALPGYTGKVRVDPITGGGFNAHGYKGRKFMLPAIWNPKTSSCWTLL